MPVKYAPAHANWVGAPTKGNPVDEQTSLWNKERHGGGLSDILTAAHSQGRVGGKEIQRKRGNILHSWCCVGLTLFSSRWTAQVLECLKLGYRSGPRILSRAWRCFKRINRASGGLMFGRHGPWSGVISVFESVLFYGFNGARPRWQLQVLAAGSG